MNPFSDFSKQERAGVYGAIILMLLCLGVFLFYDRLNFVFNPGAGQMVGFVDSEERDVRFKDHGRFDWDRAHAKQQVSLGDAIFCGESSSASVTLGKNKKIIVGERSMIKFIHIAGMDLPDLDSGNFDVKVDGEMKLAIGGEPILLQGTGSVAHVSFDEQHRPQVRAARGSVQVQPLGQSRALAQTLMQDQVSTLAKVLPPEDLRIEGSPYFWSVLDFYSEKDKGLILRETPATEVSSIAILTWNRNGGQQATVQHASDASLKYHMRAMPALGNSLKLKTVFVGANYWRVSNGTDSWSAVKRFDIEPQFIAAPPIFATSDETVQMTGPLLTRAVKWEGQKDLEHYIFEQSSKPTFPAESTSVSLLTEPQANLFLNEPGDLYYRVRGVNHELQLTAVSGVRHIQIKLPGLLKAPLLSKERLIFSTEDPEPGSLTWQGQGDVSHFQVEVFNQRKQKIGKKTTAQSELPLRPMPAGRYAFRVTPYDRLGRAGESSALKQFLFVTPVKPPPVQVPIAKKAEPKREPAEKMEESMKIPQSLRPNDSYSESVYRIQGGLVGITSSQQAEDGTGTPIMAATTIGITHWWQNNGVDGSLEFQTFKFNAAQGQTSYSDLDLEAMHRWRPNWTWFSFLRELQISAIGGLEYYRDAGAKDFSPGYELMKVGFGLDFPVGIRWDSGGQVLYGIGLDSSTKTEVLGHLDYWFKRQWSLGVGYRVYFFQAGSPAAAPDGLPYREAYGETYTVLRFRY